MLAPIQSHHLSTTHGFFTRKGGVSNGIYKGLNCGLGSQDMREAILENRGRVASHLKAETLFTAHQIHSNHVIEAPFQGEKRADAIVTKEKNIAIGVLTADCTPVLFEDKNAHVIGVAHAGWKGAKSDVLEQTIDAMIALGASRETLKAVLGPTISQKHYQVSQEFLEDFLSDTPDNMRFFTHSLDAEKYQFDLPSFCLSKLRAAHIDALWTGHCTYQDATQFYSYRRTTHQKEADYGRQISAIIMEA